ncbi:J domain-containing protein [Pseudomonas protegens]|uniref:J domain-containing protein n=1 Tax=Pseudomonas protegens TaxID=380021 RepID=UPI001E4C6A15|nr:J domain-containing protein [Pseudomonas protegens]MCD9568195.1 J domain-containing protein [Pseudomonas protegens]
MDCWSLLELPEDADERSIKRSYARQLKITRPDEDAEGFQRLREAYEQALQLARWREDEAADGCPEPVAVALPGDNLQTWSGLVEMSQPLVPQPTAAVAPTPAQALLKGLTLENLPQRWTQAQAQRCAQDFQNLLLEHCCSHPQQHAPLVEWAVQHLEWLTPWQSLSMSDAQQCSLVDALLDHYRQTLEEPLQANQERAFLAQLTHYSEQLWLQIFDHRLQWQSTVLMLLNEQQWSVPLFERVCQAFGWDEQRGAIPEPAWIWHQLVQRCQQETFYKDLQNKLQQEHSWAPEVLAAQLLAKPLSPRQQRNLTRGFTQNEWQACQQLAQTLAWRFPQLIERLPQSDVFYWQKFMPQPSTTGETWVRAWAGIALAFTLFFIQERHDPPVLAAIMAALCGWLVAVLGLSALCAWNAVALRFLDLDLWLSERLLPKQLHRPPYRRLLRHGMPFLALLALFASLLGLLGMLTYLGFTLIGVLHHKRIGHVSEAFRLKHPWLSVLHWSHFSPWQPVFLVLMVAVIRACQVFYPAFPLTRLIPG